MKIDRSLTDISSPSFLQTCSCSTCTCSNEDSETTDDCLTYIFIILYESSIWCLRIIYELFFKSLWQIFIYIKEELQYRQYDNNTRISINNSAMVDHPLISKKRHRRADQKENSSIVVVSVRSSYCQTELSNGASPTINIDLNQSEETDTFSRRLHEPLIFMNSRQNQTNNRKIYLDPVSYHHSELQLPNERKELELLTLKKETSFRDLAIQNNKLSSLDRSTSIRSPNPIDKPFVFDQPEKKIKRKRRKTDENNTPLTLTTSLHSDVTLDHIDYFLRQHIHQLFTDKHHLY